MPLLLVVAGELVSSGWSLDFLMSFRYLVLCSVVDFQLVKLFCVLPVEHAPHLQTQHNRFRCENAWYSALGLVGTR